MDDWATRGERMRKARGEEEQAMSDHAAAKEEHRKLTTQIYAARSRYECGAATNMEADTDAQLLADFERDARLKEAEWWNHPRGRSLEERAERIEQLKRGEL